VIACDVSPVAMFNQEMVITVHFGSLGSPVMRDGSPHTRVFGFSKHEPQAKQKPVLCITSHNFGESLSPENIFIA